MSKQRKIQKIIFCILAVILVIIFYEAIGIYTAYKKQPKVSSETKTAVQEEIKNWNQISENPERATIIEENNEALLQRIRLIQNAREEIILSTFAFHSDESGKLIMGALLEAANRGIKVRILADGFESWTAMEWNPYFYALSSHENIEVKIYNRANPLTPWKMMGRMHDKYLIADGSIYIFLVEEIRIIIFLVILKNIKIMTEMSLLYARIHRRKILLANCWIILKIYGNRMTVLIFMKIKNWQIRLL